MTEWKTIESAPKDGTAVFVKSVENGFSYETDIAYWDATTDRWENGVDYVSWPLTHWRPLPEPLHKEPQRFDEYGNYGENNPPLPDPLKGDE